MALLAVVLGIVLGVRASMNGDDATGVAGTVIERSEPVVTEEPTERDVQEPQVLRERRTRDRRTEQPQEPTDPAPVVVEDPAADEVVQGPVGLIRDPAPADDPEPNRPRRNRDPEPEPEPDPKPEPDPEPTQSPEPEDTTRYELGTGKGLSRDSALAMENGNSGKWDWQIKTLAGHDNQNSQQARSRDAMARLEVGFNQEARTTNEPVRDFRCDAELSAGSRRLITDDDHVFEISFWTTDGYSLIDKVDSVLLKQVVDLDPGETQMLYGNVYEDLDAADKTSYTCQVRYIKR